MLSNKKNKMKRKTSKMTESVPKLENQRQCVKYIGGEPVIGQRPTWKSFEMIEVNACPSQECGKHREV